MLQEGAQRGRRQPLAQGTDHAARHEDVLHGLSGSQGLRLKEPTLGNSTGAEAAPD
jgi:hypothetical protein